MKKVICLPLLLVLVESWHQNVNVPRRVMAPMVRMASSISEETLLTAQPDFPIPSDFILPPSSSSSFSPPSSCMTLQSLDSSMDDLNEASPQPKKSRRTPIGSTPVIAISGDSTDTTPYQQAVLATHFFVTALNFASMVDSSSSSAALDPLAAVAISALSVVIGDLGTGIFHWSVDNYGQLETPVFGSVCAAFQGHHETPWTITFRGFANNVYKICYGTIPALSIVLALQPTAGAQLFFTLFINWWMLSQEIHKYSHMKKPPRFVKALQDWGFILSRKEHGLHHSSPYEGHYCILTGVFNPVLDNTNFFRHLEKLIFDLTGNEPNTWKIEPSLKDRV